MSQDVVRSSRLLDQSRSRSPPIIRIRAPSIWTSASSSIRHIQTPRTLNRASNIRSDRYTIPTIIREA